MQHISTRIRLGGAVLLLCLTAPVAFADQVTMRIVNRADARASPIADPARTSCKPITISTMANPRDRTVPITSASVPIKRA